MWVSFIFLSFYYYFIKLKYFFKFKINSFSIYIRNLFITYFFSNNVNFLKNDLNKKFKNLTIFSVFIFLIIFIFIYFFKSNIKDFFIGFLDCFTTLINTWYELKEIVIQNKENFLIYFYSNSYFFIFFTLFIYFFNIFFLSIATFFFGVRGVFITSFISILSFWISLFFFINKFVFQSMVYYLNFDFLNFFIGTVFFSFSLKIDFLTFSFLFLTTTIGLCANIYSLNYFKNEPNVDRFILFLNWFILSMSLLVVSDNAILLFLGWELIGLTSFLLINFWTLRRGTLKSAIKAFTFNKISDVFFLFFIIIISHITGSLNLTDWEQYFLLNNFLNLNFINISGFFLILSSSIKSAQIFGHLWLPDSMEAPIPASALIHSATLVSAGVFLLLKFYWAINTSFLNSLIFFLGVLTSIYGAIVSAAQTDCKKLLAYSTISHCGFLFITIAINNLYLTITYLYLHGLFKALTFFCVGNLVKVSKGYQDTRKMGQLFLLLPIESILLIFCAVNLGALPFTVGYFYKYLFQSFFLDSNYTFISYSFLLFSMITSVIYVFRLIFYSLFDLQKNNDPIYEIYINRDYADYQYSNSTILGWFFILLLILFSVFLVNVYILYFRNFLIDNLHYNYLVTDIKYMFTKININYFIFFYIIFIAIVTLLVLIECRDNFNHLHKKNLIYNIFFVFFISQIIILTLGFFYI